MLHFDQKNNAGFKHAKGAVKKVSNGKVHEAFTVSCTFIVKKHKK